jgi:hypothetical protein
MAEDAAQEERQRHLRHAVAVRHRRLGHRARHHRELPDPALLPNERAIEPQITAIYRRFGLNDRQIEIIARAMPKRDYYCQSRRGNRLFELGLSTSRWRSAPPPPRPTRPPSPHRRRAWPDGFLAAWLRHRGVGWAADLIPNLTNLEKCHETCRTRAARLAAALLIAPRSPHAGDARPRAIRLRRHRSTRPTMRRTC